MKTSTLSRRLSVAVAAIALCIAADDSVAHGGSGGNDHGHSDQGHMSSMKSRDAHRSEKHSEYHMDRKDHKDHGDNDKRSRGKDSEKHAKKHKDNKTADKTHDKDKDKSAGATATTTTGKPPAPGTHGTNTIHPIINKNPAQPTPTLGMLPPNDPVGNTHPTPGTNPPSVVTVSNGLTKIEIQNGPRGVSFYSGNPEPGWLTVTNGTESSSIRGGSVTLSGAIGIGGDPNDIEVGPPTANGDRAVAIRPSAPPVPGHVPGGRGILGAIGGAVKDAGKAIGRGAVDVISVGGPTPGTPGAGEPTTSTSVQQ
jgi:hypothetical protein